jgi:MerR family transcriptional regulator, thiopeptide resistance regulator
MARKRSYLVKEVAQIAGVSVRTLHHYDELGLLAPRARTSAGYRLYDDQDLLRLQQILIGRELGLPLEEIRRSLDDPKFDRKRALLGQREQLRQRAKQTDAMLRAVDAALALLEAPQDQEGNTMDLKQIFAGFEHEQHEAEAEQRWGNTDAYKESTKRTKGYSKEDWQRCGVEQGAVYSDAFKALSAGMAPESPEAMEIAERHRLAIDRWFYPCSYAMHCGLADMYEQDSRFAENIDKYGAGLTGFLSAAIRANAKRHGG